MNTPDLPSPSPRIYVPGRPAEISPQTDNDPVTPVTLEAAENGGQGAEQPVMPVTPGFSDPEKRASSTKDPVMPVTGADAAVADPSLALPNEPEKSAFFYDASRKEYLARNARGAWLSHAVGEFKRILRANGFRTRASQDEVLSPSDRALLHFQNYCDVAYAGSLAGYAEGYRELNGHRVLVTTSPRMVEPVSGSWPVLRGLLNGLLGDPCPDGADQRLYFLAWVKLALESLRTRRIRPGQALVLAGPRDCGKSLLQSLLTILFGGRSAKPYRYMTGETTFNADLFGAEHLVIEDEQPNTDIRARRNFGAQIKAFTSNPMQSCHGKFREAIGLPPFWRVSISLNDEAENLLALPPLDDSVADKLMLLHVSKKPLPMPTYSLDQRTLFWQTLCSELPAFVADVLEWEIPPALVGGRFGVNHYHHPAILEAMGALDPSVRLLELIDAELFPENATTPMEAWEGSSVELERRLTAASVDLAHEGRRLLYFANACGVYLNRLADRPQNGRCRVSFRRKSHSRLWRIEPPLREVSDEL